MAELARRDTRVAGSLKGAFVVTMALLVAGLLVWQGIQWRGVPDPSRAHVSPATAVVETGLLVFREGLEAILVLAAITASLTRSKQLLWRPVAAGSGAALGATVITWFAVVALISAIDAPALDIQAGTGLLAIVVLLVIMNWFFHKLYWTGWISHHNKRRRQLLDAPGGYTSRVQLGLALLGFSAVYREGFEVVLFLQNLRLQVGTPLVLNGASIGLGLTIIVGLLTFYAHHHLPYKKMLVLTGVMLGVVLVVMVGESVQEMQMAGWLPTTMVPLPLPGWMEVWFAIFPNVEGLLGQLLAATVVLSSYAGAQYLRSWKPRRLARSRARQTAQR